MATLQEILVSVREASFDRFPIPVFLLKAVSGKYVTNTSTEFKILPTSGSITPDYTYTYNPDENDDKLDSLIAGLIGAGYPVAYTGYFSSYEAPSTLLKYTNANLSQNLQFLRRFFMSDTRLTLLVLDYYKKVLEIDTETTSTIATSVQDLEEDTLGHMILWMAINIVELRRVAELSASVFNMNWTDGSGAIAGSNLNFPGDSINVNIGSVFSLSDDNSITSNYFQDDFNRVGSDNVLGDKESFWFKLFLHLRRSLEGLYGDYNFRHDNVIVGRINLEKDLNYLAFYDSYPFTLSPLTRNIR